jgi:hypothetical protein
MHRQEENNNNLSSARISHAAKFFKMKAKNSGCYSSRILSILMAYYLLQL